MIKRTALYWPKLQKHLFNKTIEDKWQELLNDVDELIKMQK